MSTNSGSVLEKKEEIFPQTSRPFCDEKVEVSELFSVEAYHVSMRGGNVLKTCEAIVKVAVGGKIYHKAAEGCGPVNALEAALLSALIEPFPCLEQVRLAKYELSIVDDFAGSAAKTSVTITLSDRKGSTWVEVGVDENIIEASLNAFVKGFITIVSWNFSH